MGNPEGDVLFGIGAIPYRFRDLAGLLAGSEPSDISSEI